MLVEFNSYSINDSVIKLYCTKVEETFGRDRYRPQEVVFAFDTTNIFNTNILMSWLVRQKRVQKLKGENPTWGDVLGAILGTVVNVNWSRFRVYE
ncbi:hypothetical protein [uncultured Eubacterium sp.]|uniref:hypothetical protein n=1 Tax=unclassified Eubacterium TaxID=3100185 RepID=UPI0025E8BDFE|nr:hypothetical protein [uncultured Eubacterium sp.]